MNNRRERLYIYDTTLRDGQQTPGVDFSLNEKIQIAKMLDELGVDFVEGGYPGANPTDTAFFNERRTESAVFTAFGMTKRVGVSVSNDPGLNTLLAAEADAICFVAKAWDYHVKVALGCTNEENLESVRESIKAAREAGKRAMLDCEHFFDGYKANPDYALSVAKTAYDAGAEWVILCDTNGGTLPHEIAEIVSAVVPHVPGDHLGIHTHNDTENAVANSLAAVLAGARQIQGTINGIGERCGNANLVSLLPTLLLKPEFAARFELKSTLDEIKKITALSRVFNEIINQSSNRQAPYVGTSAFATKAGIHASAIIKEPETYEHVPPETVGNKRHVMVSEQAGKSNLLSELARMGIEIDRNDRRLDGLLQEIKERESRGYSYEAADASLELLARRRFGKIDTFFEVDSFRVIVERRFNALGNIVTYSEAVVKVKVDGEEYHSVAEGNGPVNALDIALRKDLGKYQEQIKDLELIDFKVRILNGGTEAITRVLIESRDGKGNQWFTVGVSENIIDASFDALVDSIRYKLFRENHTA
ncbi:MAG: citramalate synthase [Rhizobiales bacterium]|nr:citramalate synthase [Hyphomicrobiales bacterium]